MGILEKKEKNLNELLDKLNVLTSTYSHSTYKSEKIETEKNELIRKKLEIEKKNQGCVNARQSFRRPFAAEDDFVCLGGKRKGLFKRLLSQLPVRYLGFFHFLVLLW